VALRGCFGVDVGNRGVDLGEAASAEDGEAEVAAALGSFVLRLGEHGANQPDQPLAVGKMPTTSVPRRISADSWLGEAA